MNDAELLRAFESRPPTISLDQWSHRLHVRIAFMFLQTSRDFDHALQRMRDGVKTFNAHHQVPESPTSGYNETTTVAFLRLIDTTMRAYGSTFPTADSDAFCDTHPQLMNKHALRLFYSPQRRMHPDAKTRFIEPDLAPLPRV